MAKERLDILERKQDILTWIEEGQPKAYICRELNCKPDTLNRYLEKMGIEYKGNQSRKGLSHPDGYHPAAEYLGTNKLITTFKLKNKLLKEGIKEYKCECCGRTEWLGQPIPLELHHINGVPDDNRLENLQILCPNCHAFTENYRGKNKHSVEEESE